MKKNILFVAKIALPLLIICTLCAALLAGVNMLTAPVIDENAAQTEKEAIISLFGDGGLTAAAVEYQAEGLNKLYSVTLSNGEKAFCANVTSKSKYGGDVNAMVSVGADGRALDVQILTHSETFMSKYTDGNGKYNGIDKVSGATYSYNAIKDAMKIAEDAVAGFGGAK